jgi:hypothetical protein
MAGLTPSRLCTALFFLRSEGFLRVELRGFDSLTYTAQKRHDSFPELAKFPANNYILGVAVFSTPQDIRLGCCSVAAHEARSAGLDSATF